MSERDSGGNCLPHKVQNRGVSFFTASLFALSCDPLAAFLHSREQKCDLTLFAAYCFPHWSHDLSIGIRRPGTKIQDSRNQRSFSSCLRERRRQRPRPDPAPCPVYDGPCQDVRPKAHSGYWGTLWGAYHRTRNRGSRFTGQIDSAHRGLPFGSQPSRTIHGSRRDAELALAELRVEHSHCLTPLSHTTLDVLIDQFLSAPTRSGSPRGPGNGESAGLVLWRYRNTACIFML